MTSTRLPGKVMMQVQGKSLLEHHLERVRRARLVDETVVATTTRQTDDPIVELCRRLDVPWVRGSESDVLSRYMLAARGHNAEAVVRVTSDCPLIDPEIMDRTIQAFLDGQPNVDYASNRLTPSFPRGLDTEVLSMSALESADREGTLPSDREHVTYFVWRQPERFRLVNVASPRDLSAHRWTVDTVEDLTLVKHLIDSVYPTRPEFTLADCLSAIERNPSWTQINAHVEQKAP